MARERPELQRFDFGEDLAPVVPADPGRGHDATTALKARVEAVARLAVHEAPGGAGALGEGPHPEAARAERLAPEAFEEADTETLSVAQFYDRLRRALLLCFPDELWVAGEIRGLRESRGHHYLELCDKNAGAEGRPPAQLEVVCWAREWPPVAAALAAAGVELEVGRVVRVRGRVSVWDGGSKLRFTLTALDVEALLGGIAAARRRLLSALSAEGLLEANRRLPVSLVPLRIGVVTSVGSEAHRDFVGRLERSGYRFEVHLQRSLVQGPEAPGQIANALARLRRFAPDLVVIVRGGGARGDLAAFDSEVVARAIATAPFPVWSGIGHSGDRSVADEVAHASFITPTACGEAVVARVQAYLADVDRRIATLSSLARARLDGAEQALLATRATLRRAARHELEAHRQRLEGSRTALARTVSARHLVEAERLSGFRGGLRAAAARAVEHEERRLSDCGRVLRAYDPARQFERGWSITRDAAGAVVRSVGDLEPGARIHTRLLDGAAVSVVEELSAATEPGSTGRSDGRSPT